MHVNWALVTQPNHMPTFIYLAVYHAEERLSTVSGLNLFQYGKLGCQAW